ncbi:uncharacterized protein TNCV_1803031 [Trichonephila clavipes]|uniref:Uncharacterized protein n=1 Tax=Trichonephila clavipes TaxID=2585209 RepID=A0A8X6VCL9_TRICX|nr:uncharacterized protein TNCV_1803031 [Trichonephila clavipes]
MASQFGEIRLRNSCLAFIQLNFNFPQGVGSLIGKSSAYYARGLVGKDLEGALEFNRIRKDQTAVSRLLSGHLKGMTFKSGHKVFQTCSKCHLLPASLGHILDCLGLALEDVHASPLLMLDFGRVNGLVNLI